MPLFEKKLVSLKEVIRKRWEQGRYRAELNELKDKEFGVSEYSLNAAETNVKNQEKIVNDIKEEINKKKSENIKLSMETDRCKDELSY